VPRRRPEASGESTVYVGALTLDVMLGDVRSLKQKRSAVRPLIAEVNRRFPGASVAETGHLDLHRRAEIGIAVAASTAARAVEVLDACERFVAARPDIELLSARQRLFTEEEPMERRQRLTDEEPMPGRQRLTDEEPMPGRQRLIDEE
jgi:uncharacterized protein